MTNNAVRPLRGDTKTNCMTKNVDVNGTFIVIKL